MTPEQKALIRNQLAKYPITNRMGFVRWMIRVFKAGEE
jgi:hypothetical protein